MIGALFAGSIVPAIGCQRSPPTHPGDALLLIAGQSALRHRGPMLARRFKAVCFCFWASVELRGLATLPRGLATLPQRTLT